VTGAGRGIGRAIALHLARAGATLAITGREPSRLESLVAELAGFGDGKPSIHQIDVADPDAVASGAADMHAAHPSIDILVNNAGIAAPAPLAKTDMALWERHLAINATAPYLLSRALLPGMLDRGWGRIVNIASMAGLGGAPYITAYAASKHALVGLTRAL